MFKYMLLFTLTSALIKLHDNMLLIIFFLYSFVINNYKHLGHNVKITNYFYTYRYSHPFVVMTNDNFKCVKLDASNINIIS